MQQAGDYITKEKREEFLLELEDLKGPKRAEILANLEYAKSLGDLSENAEYHQAREEQAKLEGRIAKIEQILQSSETFSRHKGDVIQLGSEVIVLKEDKKEGKQENKTFTIVGSEEADMVAGKISNRSPFGEALLGKKKGASVSFKTPGGVVNYKIINVS